MNITISLDEVMEGVKERLNKMESIPDDLKETFVQTAIKTVTESAEKDPENWTKGIDEGISDIVASRILQESGQLLAFLRMMH